MKKLVLAGLILPLLALGLSSCETPPLIVVAVGDIHSGGPDSDAVATKNLTQSINPNFILGLGDYAYSGGTQTEYNCNGCFDDDWGQLVNKMYPVLAPTHDQDWRAAYPLLYWNGAGDHGYKSPQNLQAFTPYSKPSGNWHFVALPDACYRVSSSECNPDSITTWLNNDLTNNTSPCTVVYWHQPYFTSVSTGHGRFTDVRPWIDVLYVHHVDLLLQGHQHGYERFARQDPNLNQTSQGIRSVTSGTGGIGHYAWTSTAPNSVFQDDTSFGVLKLTLEQASNHYAGDFIRTDGQVLDHFEGNCLGGG